MSTQLYDHSYTSHSYLLDGLHGWGRVLVAAQVDHDPSDVAEEGDGYGGADEGQEWFNHTQTDDVISALRTITCNSTVIIHPRQHSHPISL